MPRYLLDHAVTAHAFANHGAENPAARKGDFGRFWFNGYAVHIRMLRSGKMQAERVIQGKTVPGVDGGHGRTACRLLQAVWYWLRTRVGAEGGERWILGDRDSADVISQTWSTHRQRSLASYVPEAAPGVAWKSAEGVASPPAVAAPDDGELSRVAFGATPVLERVLDFIGIGGRLTLVPTGLHAPTASDRVLMRARGIRTLADLKAFATDFGFRPSSPAQSQLSPSQQGQVLGELVDVVAKLPAAHRREATQYLTTVALILHRASEQSDLLTVFVQRCIDARLPPSFLAGFIVALKLEPVATTASARFALLSDPVWRQAFHGELLPDTATYTEMIGALTSPQAQHHLHDIMAVLVEWTAVDSRVGLWRDIYDHACCLRATKPAIASRQLAALARFIGSDASPAPGRFPTNGERIASCQWQLLSMHLKTRSPQGFDVAELACQLALALQSFGFDSAVRMDGMATLAGVEARLTTPERVRVGLAQLPLRPDESRTALWKSLWKRIKNERLNGCAVEAIAQLAAVPDADCWHSVLDYCSDRTTAWPTQRAEILRVLIALSERDDVNLGAVDAAAIRAHIGDAALRLVRDGGSAEPLARCRWMPDAEVLYAIVAHVPWPERARALTLRLEESTHPLQARDIALLQAQMAELGKRAGKDGHDDMRRAFASLAMAIAEKCDAQGLNHPQAWNAMVGLANSVLPAVAAGLDPDGAPGFVAQAALVDSLMRIAAARPDSVPPAAFARIGRLWDDTWDLLHRLPAADRQAVLDALGDRMRASGPKQAPGRRHCWSEKALQQVLWGLTGDVPDRGRIVSQMVWAERQPEHRRNGACRFDDMKRRILTEALCLPDEQFGRVASDMIGMGWFEAVPPDTGEHRNAWLDAMDVVVRRIERMPAFERAALLLQLRLRRGRLFWRV